MAPLVLRFPLYIYLKGNVWVEIPDGTRVAIVDSEFRCLDSHDNVLAKFEVTDVQLYSRIKLRTGLEEDEGGDVQRVTP
jgi:hypothetical protein